MGSKQNVKTLKQNGKNQEKRYIILSIIFFVLVSAAYIWVFMGQYYTYPTNHTFPSDLLIHIQTGKDVSGSYSIMYILLGFLNNFPNPGFVIAIFLTMFLWLSVYISKLLLAFLNKNISASAAWFWHSMKH